MNLTAVVRRRMKRLLTKPTQAADLPERLLEHSRNVIMAPGQFDALQRIRRATIEAQHGPAKPETEL